MRLRGSSLTLVGIATGMLMTAQHSPANERPFLLLVTGFPADNAMVPDIQRKRLDQFTTFL